MPAESAHPYARHGTCLGVSSSCCEASTTRSRCGVRDACIRGHVCTCISRCRVRDSSTHFCFRVSRYHKNGGANSLPNSDSAGLDTETGTHRANCAEARGDSTVASLGHGYLHARCCATTGVHGPDRAEGPWSFHSCSSSTCPLF